MEVHVHPDLGHMARGSGQRVRTWESFIEAPQYRAANLHQYLHTGMHPGGRAGLPRRGAGRSLRTQAPPKREAEELGGGRAGRETKEKRGGIRRKPREDGRVQVAGAGRPKLRRLWPTDHSSEVDTEPLPATAPAEASVSQGA